MILFNMLVWINGGGGQAPWLQCVEHYSGVGRIAEAFRDHDHPAQEFDVLRHATHENALTCEGLMAQLAHTCNTCEYGLNWWATVCSTWVWMSRGTTLRGAQDPEGNTDLPGVRDANTQVWLSFLMGGGVGRLLRLQGLWEACEGFEVFVYL